MGPRTATIEERLNGYPLSLADQCPEEEFPLRIQLLWRVNPSAVRVEAIASRASWLALGDAIISSPSSTHHDHAGDAPPDSVGRVEKCVLRPPGDMVDALPMLKTDMGGTLGGREVGEVERWRWRGRGRGTKNGESGSWNGWDG